MKNPILKVISAVGLGLSFGWVLAAQEPKPADAAKKDWKGQEEYNLFQNYQKADTKGKLDALDKWKAAFPASDFAEEREEQYLIIYQQTNMNRQAFDKAAEILKTRPNHFYSLSAIERLIYTLPPPPKTQDLEVNPLKSKQLTNFRASGPKDEGIRLTPPRRMSLEQAIAYIEDDELVEVTPKAVRIRKRFLDPHERKRAARKLEAA